MQEFIQHAAKELGISSESAEEATGGLLSLIKTHASTADFEALLGTLPGASGMMAHFSDDNPLSSNPLASMLGGSVGQMLGGALGSKMGGAATMLGLLKSLDLNAEELGRFATMFFEYVREHLGEELTNRLMSKLPEIARMVAA